MSHALSNKEAWLFAASWGSFMTSGDPGACMYGFDESFLLQSEAHRRNVLAYARECRNNVRACPSSFDQGETRKLRAFRRKVRVARLESDSNDSLLDEFSRAYVTAALWSTNDNSDPETGGDPLDDNYGVEDVARPTLLKMIADCRRFQDENAADLEAAYACRIGMTGEYDSSNAGHDFWLTRNRHGVGFWDRGLGDIGDKLSEACRRFGEVDLYVGDDRQIHA